MKDNQIILKQKEVLANFYANFALIWLTYGIVSPFFISFKELLENILIVIVRLIVTLIISRVLLNLGLNKLK